MSEAVLGIIGGLGPLATACFLEELAKMTDAPTEQDHADMIIYNFPSIPDHTGYILGSNLRSPLPGLLWAGRALAREGVCAIAIPCVTAHFFYRELAEQLNVEVINGVRETAAYLKDRGVRRAGLMATEGTVVSGLFARELMDAGIAPVLPNREGQADINHLIYQNIKAGRPAEMDRFFRVDRNLRDRGAEAVILGCTELSTLRRDRQLGPGYLDTTQVLAAAAIRRCGKSLRREYACLITGEGMP